MYTCLSTDAETRAVKRERERERERKRESKRVRETSEKWMKIKDDEDLNQRLMR